MQTPCDEAVRIKIRHAHALNMDLLLADDPCMVVAVAAGAAQIDIAVTQRLHSDRAVAIVCYPRAGGVDPGAVGHAEIQRLGRSVTRLRADGKGDRAVIRREAG